VSLQMMDELQQRQITYSVVALVLGREQVLLPRFLCVCAVVWTVGTPKDALIGDEIEGWVIHCC